jgi:hypothetical protein
MSGIRIPNPLNLNPTRAAQALHGRFVLKTYLLEALACGACPT